MTKTIKKSEKENSQLRKKCEQTDFTLIELAEEVLFLPYFSIQKVFFNFRSNLVLKNKKRNNYRKQVDTLTQQKKRLEEVCRVLQSERDKLYAHHQNTLAQTNSTK
jgi:hypothetical protein